MFESMNEFMRAMLATFPEATVEEDEYGQLVVYTNLTSTGDADAPVVSLDTTRCDECGEVDVTVED